MRVVYPVFLPSVGEWSLCNCWSLTMLAGSSILIEEGRLPEWVHLKFGPYSTSLGTLKTYGFLGPDLWRS